MNTEEKLVNIIGSMSGWQLVEITEIINATRSGKEEYTCPFCKQQASLDLEKLPHNCAQKNKIKEQENQLKLDSKALKDES